MRINPSLDESTRIVYTHGDNFGMEDSAGVPSAKIERINVIDNYHSKAQSPTSPVSRRNSPGRMASPPEMKDYGLMV